MSSTAKVLLILGSIAGICLLACCGGVAFLGWKFQGVVQTFAENFTTKDPNEIRARTAQIMHIDIPDSYPPLQAFDWMLMKQIIYGRQPGPMVMIMEMNEPMQGGQGAAGMKQQRQQMLRQMKQQQGQQPGNLNAEINEESSETREFTINGEKVPFEFIKGNANGAPSRQVVGLFPGRNATTIMFLLMAPEAEYDEAAVVKMIESIRLPAESSADESDEESDMPEHAAPKETPEPAHENDEPAEAPAQSSP